MPREFPMATILVLIVCTMRKWSNDVVVTSEHRGRKGRAKLRLKSGGLRQSCGHVRPRSRYFTLLAPIVFRALLEPPWLGQSSELSFRVGPTLPILPPNHRIVRPDRRKHPGLDTLGRCAQDNRGGHVCSPSQLRITRRKALVVRSGGGQGFHKVDLGAVRLECFHWSMSCRPRPRLPERLTRHDTRVPKNRTPSHRLPRPLDDSSDRLQPIPLPFSRMVRSQRRRILLAATSGIQTRYSSNQGIQDRAKHNCVGWSFDGSSDT